MRCGTVATCTCSCTPMRLLPLPPCTTCCACRCPSQLLSSILMHTAHCSACPLLQASSPVPAPWWCPAAGCSVGAAAWENWCRASSSRSHQAWRAGQRGARARAEGSGSGHSAKRAPAPQGRRTSGPLSTTIIPSSPVHASSCSASRHSSGWEMPGERPQLSMLGTSLPGRGEVPAGTPRTARHHERCECRREAGGE